MKRGDVRPAAEFVDRHCGPSDSDRREMLRFIGMETMEELGGILPPEIVSDVPDICRPMTEDQATALLSQMARCNTAAVSMIGLGYYGTSMPAVVRRNLLESAAWYTAYTPYQAEISQGRLEMILNFQTMVADLTGLPLAGASLLDEATAAAEAMTLVAPPLQKKRRLLFGGRNFVSANFGGAQNPGAAAGDYIKNYRGG